MVKPEWEEQLRRSDGRLLQEVLLEPVYPEDELRVTGWRMLVGCCLLNQTSRRQVDGVWPALFSRFGRAEDLAYGGAGSIADMHRLLTPLGLASVRGQRILALSAAWLNGRTIGWSVDELPGCGDYARDSWEIFVCNDRTIQPGDKELRRYLGLPQMGDT